MSVDDEWITTSEATRRLGLKKETLYAYVSRGVLVSRRRPGQQQSLFRRAEIDNLAATKRGSRKSGPDLLRFRAVATGVSSLNGSELLIRGVPVHQLAASMSFAEATRFVLRAPTERRPRALTLDRASRSLVARQPAPRRAPVLSALLAAADPLHRRTDARSATETTLGFIDLLADTVRDSIDIDNPWVQSVLVSLLDNGMTVSTTAARVAASSRAGVLDCFSAAYGAMSGPLHGSAPTAAYDLISDVLRGAPPRDAVARALERFGAVPGFGHVVYDSVDPRAELLLRTLRRTHRGSDVLRVASAVRRVMDRPMNVDFVIAAGLHALEYDARTGEVLFQLGRTAGIGAHVIEEYAEAPLRWRANNT